MLKVIILRGLPGSGKTTLAKKTCSNLGNCIRVNNDELRLMFNQSHNLSLICVLRDTVRTIITAALNNNYDVIVDNTNLSKDSIQNIKKAIKDSNKEHVKINIVDLFDVPVETCIERDSHREKPVGKDVILSMYRYYKHVIDNKEKT